MTREKTVFSRSVLALWELRAHDRFERVFLEGLEEPDASIEWRPTEGSLTAYTLTGLELPQCLSLAFVKTIQNRETKDGMKLQDGLFGGTLVSNVLAHAVRDLTRDLSRVQDELNIPFRKGFSAWPNEQPSAPQALEQNLGLVQDKVSRANSPHGPAKGLVDKGDAKVPKVAFGTERMTTR